jgi:hydrogenase/urease accessory protein HupE
MLAPARSDPSRYARRTRRWAWSTLRAFLLCSMLAVLVHAPVRAHSGGTTGFATVVISGQTVRHSLALNVGVIPLQLADEMRLGQPGFAPTYQPLVAAVERRIRIRSDESACEPAPGSAGPSPADPANIVVVVDFACAPAPRSITIRDDLSDVLGDGYHTLANIQWPGGGQQFVFQADSRETRVVVAEGMSKRGAGSFFLLGIEHILTGYDHLLFLLALIMRGGNLWSLFKIITAFTIAHSITLALAALGIVTLPERVVEATIALSIAYVATENLFMRKAVSRRWAVSFLFGLVHGFGFSNVLRELGLPREGLIWSLLNFNLGVEVGQAAAVVAAVPLLLWLRRFRWESRAVAAVSIVTLAVGLTLFAERALFAS